MKIKTKKKKKKNSNHYNSCVIAYRVQIELHMTTSCEALISFFIICVFPCILIDFDGQDTAWLKG